MANSVPLIGTGLGYKSLTVNAQRRENVYLEPQNDQDKSQVTVYGRPGLTLVKELGADLRAIAVNYTNNRVTLVYADTMVVYSAYDWNTPFATLTATTSANRGLIDTATDGAIVVFAPLYEYLSGGTPTGEISAYSDADPLALLSLALYSGATGLIECVGYSDGYFVAAAKNSGSFYFTTPEDINGGSGNFAQASTDVLTAFSFGDHILRLKGKNNYLMVFGQRTTEFWQVTPSAEAPFQPVRGLSQKWGLAAKWSLAETQEGFVFIGESVNGGYHVCKLAGTTITPIIDHEFEAILLDYAQAGLLEDAIGTLVDWQGHALYFLTFPAAGKSWMLDLNTNVWSETTSGANYFLGTISSGWGGQTYIGGRDGNLYKFDDAAYKDGDEHMAREIITRHFWKDHDRVTVDAIRADFESGVGLATGQGSDPQVMLQISRDNGKTWGDERWTTIGALGNYYTRAEWRRCGSGRDFLFKIRMTDPVKFVISGLSIRAQPWGS